MVAMNIEFLQTDELLIPEIDNSCSNFILKLFEHPLLELKHLILFTLSGRTLQQCLTMSSSSKLEFFQIRTQEILETFLPCLLHL